MSFLTFHDGKLEVPEELQRNWKLAEGSQLQVIDASPARILLHATTWPPVSSNDAIAGWRSLGGILPDLRTPETHARAVLRKEQATKHLEDVYASPLSATTAIRAAEREWELADDELDFGPFPER